MLPVTYHFPYAGLLAAVAVGLVLGVAAAVIPARQAARLQIVTALRYNRQDLAFLDTGGAR